MKTGKIVLTCIICLFLLCDVSFCRRLGETNLDKEPPNGMVQMRKSLEHTEAEHPKQSSYNTFDTTHSDVTPDRYKLNEDAENSIKDKDEDNEVYKKNSESQEIDESINIIDERIDKDINSDKDDKKTKDIAEKEEKKEYADDLKSKSDETEDSNNPRNEISDKLNMGNDHDNEHKLKHTTIVVLVKNENVLSDPNVFNRKLNGNENPEKEDVKTKTNVNGIHNGFNGTGNVITDAKSDKKDDSRKSNPYDKPYKKYTKPEIRESKTQIRISEPDAKEQSKKDMDVPDYVKDSNAHQYLRDKKGPHNNQNKYGQTEHQEDELKKGEHGTNDANINTISNEHKDNIEDPRVTSKWQIDHTKSQYDTQRKDGRTSFSVKSDTSEGVDIPNQVHSREFIKNDKAIETSNGELAAKVGHAETETMVTSNGTLESPIHAGTDTFEIETHQTDTIESEGEGEEKRKQQEKDDNIPKELDNPVMNHSNNTAKQEVKSKLESKDDGTLTTAKMTMKSSSASTATQTSTSKETSTLKKEVLPHTTTVLRFQSESVTKIQVPSAGEHRTTNVPNKIPDLNPIDEYICNGGYSRAAVVSGIVGGMFFGGGLVFLFFYCKRRCSKYIKGDYRPVPMEYDFELNPRYKNT